MVASFDTAGQASREQAFGQGHDLSAVDRLGTWLSRRAVARRFGSLEGKTIADVGAGFEATLTRSLLGHVAHATVLDVAIAPDLHAHPKVTAIEGPLPATLEKLRTGSIDVVFCINVLEHLWDDRGALVQMRRVLAPGGHLMVNVPSWRGKTALEISAFRLGLSPRAEMDDHKRYYDPRDLWPLLVEAGFLPHNINCRRHKAGLNTVAVCTAQPDSTT